MTWAVGAIDLGTTSTRFMIFDHNARVLASTQQEFQQIYPQPGWVEHDPIEIWETTQAVVQKALDSAGLTRSDLAAVGIANQRETTMIWDRSTGRPLADAIVWMDTRTDSICAQLAGGQGIDRFRSIAGLPISTYFSGPKAVWLLANIEGAAERARAGEVVMGTMDSWLLWNLTGGRHITDVTNASRTLLLDLESLSWSQKLLDAMDIPLSMMAEVVPSIGRVGIAQGVLEGVPISAVLGDQHAALFGQAAFDPGEAKNTYGTGCFMVLNTGSRVNSTRGLLTTLGYQIAGQPPVFALEGSVAVAGSLVQWLRDNLGLFTHSRQIEELAAEVEDNGGVYFVPAFSGLFAPHWRSDARGVIAGLTHFAKRGHIARAALEATAFQTREIMDAMRADSGVNLTLLKVDGGMVVNNLLMQFQSDILDVPVVRPVVNETTALGAAYGAGLAEGFWDSQDQLRDKWREHTRWTPNMAADRRQELYQGWGKAVERTFNWVETGSD